ncbi:MAG: hypothetical protein PWP41_2026 [Moorella sp. (in: firmicutes)]|nr:hypothetical protein [Moorella sp. (in: firmicutes)]
MEIPFARWYPAINRRRSRRRYEPQLPAAEVLARLDAACTGFKPFPGARAVLVTRPADEVFRGALGSYGKIKGAPAFMAFIGSMDDPRVYEKVGYLGEGLILEATALGLATCWVAGFFRPEVAATIIGINKKERVLAVTPVGHAPSDWSLEERVMAGFGRNHQRKPLAELIAGPMYAKGPDWVQVALEAARLAPSAVNRQPWRFTVAGDSITVAVDNLQDTFNLPKRLDCGIAMLHIEVAALYYGVRGRWQFLDAPQVARFSWNGTVSAA